MHANPALYLSRVLMLDNIEFGFRGELNSVFQNFVFYLCISDHNAQKQQLLKELNSKYSDTLDQNQVQR